MSSAVAFSALTCRPAGLVAPRGRAARTQTRRAAPVKALASPVELLQLAAAGDVDAPIGAIVIGAVVVTALSFLVSAGLKPGADAAIDMQQRDSKKFNKRD